VVTATGYYPFGMPMPGRNGIAFQSDWVPGRGFVAGNTYPDYLQVASRPYAPTPDAYRAGKEVELLPGFETATGTDELLVEIQAGSGVLSNDYPGGQGSNDMYGAYRYGFNGKENDNEVKGAGNQQDYGMRIYDPRLGRFLSVDPLTYSYPYYSPYHFAGNMPIAAIDLDGLEQYVVIYEKNKYNKLFKTSIYTLKVGTELKDQEIKRINQDKERYGEPIAKGNVLVFEISNSKNLNALKLIDKRNVPNSDLTKQELQLFKANNKLTESNGKNTYYEYNESNPEYASNDFESAKFYEASKIEPLAIQGFTSFTTGGFKAGSWAHGTNVNGKLVLSNELSDYLADVKSDGNAKGITVTLNLYTQNSGYNDAQKENIKREYKKYVSRLTGISFDKVTVTGQIEAGDSNNSSLKVEVKL
jgi:RHS repeat-associated protein